ncbi:hypothetical protein LEN26_006564 [Aphanomyces euteiches]|nr:hypothetical protein AeMF1_007960 [Aphanomyces euteiches]KAH9135084.1 hypothetical protein LEN26_006564 [Aphanomyces euteiches]KAH9190490.1 hypothetical protein AeNC1_007547 [Aphanomyces euteiches]
MFDLSCRCMYANINCARLDIDDPSPLLDPEKIGTNLFYLQTSRCPLRDGLPKEMLEPFTQLSQISLFTEMQSWNGPLPSTVNNVEIRHSHLQTIPRAFVQEIPNNPVVIQLEACPLRYIPDAVFETWGNVLRVAFINVSLTQVPNGLFNLTNLQEVSLRMNQLTEIPWTLAQRDVFVDLSGNPIPSTTQIIDPQLIESRQVVVDGTPLCTSSKVANCRGFCQSNCSVDWVGDRLCNLACLTASCRYDGGDCDPFGIYPQVS